eukprot:5743925-Amphidinium_carterae.1
MGGFEGVFSESYRSSYRRRRLGRCVSLSWFMRWTGWAMLSQPLSGSASLARRPWENKIRNLQTGGLSLVECQ